jgi:hypothetical protein
VHVQVETNNVIGRGVALVGQISKKLKARFTRWGGRYRKQIGKLAKSVPVPKDVHDVRTLVAQGYDPLHALYISIQNITSARQAAGCFYGNS